MIERLLLRPGFGDAGELQRRLDSFQGFLLFYLLARDGIYLTVHHRDLYAVNLVILSANFLFYVLFRWRALTALIALGCVATKVVLTFPTSSNHLLLEFLVVSFLVLLNREELEEQKALVAAYRWLVIFTMTFAGLQKLTYATYFDGSFLASQASTERFGSFLARVLPTEEFQGLLQANRNHPAGPFRFRSAFPLLMSNAVWVLEIAVGVTLLHGRATSLAVGAALLSLAGIEIAAREFMFGLLATNLLMFFVTAKTARFVGALSAVACAVLLLGQFLFPSEMRWFN